MNSVAHYLTEWDRATFLALYHGLSCRPLDLAMPYVSDLGLGHVQVIGMLLLAVWAGWRKGEIRRAGAFRDMGRAIAARRAWVAPLLIAFALSGIASTILKTTDRERPWWFYHNQQKKGRFLDVNVQQIGHEYPLKVRGFPSGHTSTSVALAMTAGLIWGRRRPGRVGFAWLMAILIGISRIYLASHWPLDVIGGFALGTASGLATMTYYRWRTGRAPRGEEYATAS